MVHSEGEPAAVTRLGPELYPIRFLLIPMWHQFCTDVIRLPMLVVEALMPALATHAWV